MARVFILGAGASQFADFPLACGLWEFLRNDLTRPWDNGRKQNIKKLWKVAETLSGISEGILDDLEMFFNLLDMEKIRSGILKRNLIGAEISSEDISRVQRGFGFLVTDKFQEHSLRFLNESSDNEQIKEITNNWTNLLKAGDALITFNWDPLHEMILWKAKKWHWSDGYGFNVDGQTPDNHPSGVLVLKLHGSVNWALRDQTDNKISLDFVDEFFPLHGQVSAQINQPVGSTGDYAESLIIPSYLKNPFSRPSLGSLWQQAAQKIESAKEITVIGYSLPQADMPSRTLLSIALGRNTEVQNIKFVGASAFSNWQEFCRLLNKNVLPVASRFEDFVNLQGLH